MQPAAFDGASTGTSRSYLTGFVLAVLLTAIPFGLVMSGALPRSATVLVIFTAAVLQILVHLHYFLHLDTSSSQRWNMLAILVTVLIIVIMVGGSVWIMANLRSRTMDRSSTAAYHATVDDTGAKPAGNADQLRYHAVSRPTGVTPAPSTARQR